MTNKYNETEILNLLKPIKKRSIIFVYKKFMINVYLWNKSML